jgi:DNA-damage-inducible protein J
VGTLQVRLRESNGAGAPLSPHTRSDKVISTNTAETKSADVRLRLEPELKEEAARILADAGLELSIAIRIFLKQVVAHRGLPFEVRQPNAATIRAMKQAQSIAKPRFSSAKDLFDGLEKDSQGKKRHTATKKRPHKGVSKRLARSAA